MSKHGISIFERHFEKGLVGLFAVAAVGTVVWEFALNQTSIKAGGRDLAIGQIVPELERAATSLRNSTSGEFSEEIPQPTQGAATTFEANLSGGVSPVGEINPLTPRLAPPQEAAVGGDEHYYVPAFPAPREVAAAQFADAVLPEAVEAQERLAELFKGQSAPYDLAWVTPVAKIDLATARSQLAGSNLSANPPEQLVSSTWYGAATLVLDVVFERQEQKNDGSWGPTTVVAPAPWQESLRGPLKSGELTPTRREELITTLGNQDSQLAILRPGLPETRRGRGADPVAELGQSSAETAEATAPGVEDSRVKLERQFKALGKTIDTITKRLEAAGGPLSDEEHRKRKQDRDRASKPPVDGDGDGGRGSGGGGKGGPPGMGGGGMNGRRTNDGADAKAAAKKAQQADDLRRNLTRQLKDSQDRYAAMAKELGLDGTVVATAAATPGSGAISLASDDILEVWTHDVAVTPGRTYRYRATVQHFNPFFGREALLADDQKSLSRSPVTASAVSDWSEPVRVSQRTPFFLDTVAKSLAGPMEATFDVFRFHDGDVKTVESSVRIGDVIGHGKGDENTGDFTTGWLIAGIEQDPYSALGGSQEQFIVVIQDVATGELFQQRAASVDRGSAERIRLAAEASAGSQRGTELPTVPAGSGSGGTLGGGEGAGSGPPGLSR